VGSLPVSREPALQLLSDFFAVVHAAETEMCDQGSGLSAGASFLLWAMLIDCRCSDD
jgi:hypothetical protein